MVTTIPEARGNRLPVVEDKEAADDLVRDMTEILGCFRARFHGPRCAAYQAREAISIDKSRYSKQVYRSYQHAVAKMVDFSRTTAISHSRGLRRAAAPTVQGGSARESHPGTPNWSPLKPHCGLPPAQQPEPDWVCVSAFPAGAALQAPVSAVPIPHPSTSIRASPASLQVR